LTPAEFKPLIALAEAGAAKYGPVGEALCVYGTLKFTNAIIDEILYFGFNIGFCFFGGTNLKTRVICPTIIISIYVS
jgi:hypothetical protein